MPIVWSPENEARLLAGLFKVCEIKVSGAQLKELASIIGPDCTAKAVTHRIAKFKKMASAFNGGKKGGEAAADGESDDTAENDGAESTPKTPKSTKKAGKGGKGGKKRAVTEDEDDEDQVAKKLKAEDSDNYQ